MLSNPGNYILKINFDKLMIIEAALNNNDMQSAFRLGHDRVWCVASVLSTQWLMHALQYYNITNNSKCYVELSCFNKRLLCSVS